MQTIFSTAWSVSVTRSKPRRHDVNIFLSMLLSSTDGLTVPFGPYTVNQGSSSSDHRSCSGGELDEKIMNFLEIWCIFSKPAYCHVDALLLIGVDDLG